MVEVLSPAFCSRAHKTTSEPFFFFFLLVSLMVRLFQEEFEVIKLMLPIVL